MSVTLVLGVVIAVVPTSVPVHVTTLLPSDLSLQGYFGRDARFADHVDARNLRESQEVRCQSARFISSIQAILDAQIPGLIRDAIIIFRGGEKYSWTFVNRTLQRRPVLRMVMSPRVSVKSAVGDSASFPSEALLDFGAALVASYVQWTASHPGVNCVIAITIALHFFSILVAFLWLFREFFPLGSCCSLFRRVGGGARNVVSVSVRPVDSGEGAGVVPRGSLTGPSASGSARSSVSSVLVGIGRHAGTSVSHNEGLSRTMSMDDVSEDDYGGGLPGGPLDGPLSRPYWQEVGSEEFRVPFAMSELDEAVLSMGLGEQAVSENAR